MTVHRLEVLTHVPDGMTFEEVERAVDGWVDQQPRALIEEDTPLFEDGGPDAAPPTAEPYIVGSWRFSVDIPKSQLLARAEGFLQGHVDWYVIRYFGCDHDAEDPVGCTKNDDRKWGGVPDGVVV